MSLLSLSLSLAWICTPAFLYGYHISLLNSLVSSMTCSEFEQGGPLFAPCVEMTSDQFSFLTGIYTVGGLLGSLSAGTLLERKGRRRATTTSSALIAFGSLLMTVAGTVPLLLVGRLVAGVGCGLATVVVPLILDRLAQATSTSRIGIFNQLAITVGILAALALAIPFGARGSWRWVPATSMLLALGQLLAAPLVPNSMFTVQADASQVQSTHHEERGLLPKDPETPQTEPELLDESHQGVKVPSLGLFETLASKEPTVRIGLAVVILTQLMQQLSGINAVMYYSTDILSDVIPTGARYISLLVAIANCVLTLAPILLVAWAGRKKLLLMSAALCSLNTMVLGIGIRTNSSFLSTCGVIAFVSSFSLGLGAIPFVLIGEVMPVQAAGAAGSIGLTLNWATNGLVAISFSELSKMLAEVLGPGGVFFAFSGITVILMLAVTHLYKEQ